MPFSQRIWITRLEGVPTESQLDTIARGAARWFEHEHATGVALSCGRLFFVFSESRTLETPGASAPGFAGADSRPQLLVERRAPGRLCDDWSFGVVEPTPLTDSDPDATNLSLACIWSALPENASPEHFAQALFRTDLVLHPLAMTDLAA